MAINFCECLFLAFILLCGPLLIYFATFHYKITNRFQIIAHVATVYYYKVGGALSYGPVLLACINCCNLCEKGYFVHCLPFYCVS